jgi:hypothetical protein
MRSQNKLWSQICSRCACTASAFLANTSLSFPEKAASHNFHNARNDPPSSPPPSPSPSSSSIYIYSRVKEWTWGVIYYIYSWFISAVRARPLRSARALRLWLNDHQTRVSPVMHAIYPRCLQTSSNPVGKLKPSQTYVWKSDDQLLSPLKFL